MFFGKKNLLIYKFPQKRSDKNFLFTEKAIDNSGDHTQVKFVRKIVTLPMIVIVIVNRKPEGGTKAKNVIKIFAQEKSK